MYTAIIVNQYKLIRNIIKNCDETCTHLFLNDFFLYFKYIYISCLHGAYLM